KIQKTDDVEILYELLKAHEYWRLKDLRVDLVILVMENYSYTNPLLALITDIVQSSQGADNLNRRGDIFILNINVIAPEDVFLLSAVARLCFHGQKGTIVQQLQLLPRKVPKEFKQPVDNMIEASFKGNLEFVNGNGQVMVESEQLQFNNGLGGFGPDNDRYIIHLENGQTTPVPWSNVVANAEFGFIVTESGGGYTWCTNSRENKLTPWSNDPICDSPSEVFYLCDEDVNIWSVTPLPIREASLYTIEHGFGYSSFKHNSHGISQSLVQFVPLKGKVKISRISLKNEEQVERNLSLTYFITPLLGVSTTDTAMHLISSVTNEGILTLENPYNQDFPNQVLFMDTSVEQRTYTGNRNEFFGQGDSQLPEALKRTHLSNEVGVGYDPCASMQVQVKIKPGETLELVFVMGVANGFTEVLSNSQQFNNIQGADAALLEVRKFWHEKLQILQIQTPDLAMNQMVNGWLLYQVIACRLWARTAFYQAGGAYGFRDQLQDSLALLDIWPEITRAQIIKHAKHQFVQGDVLHWWHEPMLKGTRTRISDDFLWLPFVVAEYILNTNEMEILNEDICYIEGEVLKDFEEERYMSPWISEESGTLYEHCIRAIENGLKFGEHGLPLMGTGDWNDGMTRVGNEGKGESVWLAWFLVTILNKWIPLCQKRGDLKQSDTYSAISKDLVIAIEKHGWDGNWYKRAFFDDGSQLGTTNNRECKIDSLTQTWAVLSRVADPDRSIQAMSALEDYLVSHKDGIVRLLTPPFDNGELEPGYIKGYVPGVRENGGQYTHAAAWAVAAFAQLGDGDNAFELFELINPINHARTNIELAIYKVEPYVMAADVYGCQPHIGRGGWTWYTGAAGWMYQAGLKNILGFTKEGLELIIDPCIPKRWSNFSISYTYELTTYDIQVSNPDNISHGIVQLFMEGTELIGNKIPLESGKGIKQITAIMKTSLDGLK
ncbi:MAG: glycosyl transferase, partial [Vallitaleaceae bacterium]|nr:glycosyl transferase [Vallitaleaceae bacterium]